MTTKIRVGVIDQHPLFRDGVVFALEQQADMDTVAQGATLRDALMIARDTAPDVLVLDMSLPDSTPDAIATIIQQHPTLKILLLTMVADEQQISAALAHGVRGCLLKGTSGRELVQAVRVLHQGECYVSPGLAAKILTRSDRQPTQAQKPVDRFVGLTPREEQILSILGKGRSNKEIGNKLDLTEKTVKHHVTNILQKLQVRNRVEAALLISDRTPQRLGISQS